MERKKERIIRENTVSHHPSAYVCLKNGTTKRREKKKGKKKRRMCGNNPLIKEKRKKSLAAKGAD